MTPRRRRALIGIALVAAVLLGATIAAHLLVPRWLGGKIQTVVSAALGRKLTIGGPFEVSWWPFAVTAGDVRLANVPGGVAPFLARSGRIRVGLELASLFTPPIHVTAVELDDIEIHFERDSAGRPNWAFDLPERPSSAPPKPGPQVVVDRAVIKSFAFGYDGAHDARPLALAIDAFDAVRDPATDMLTLRGAGTFNDAPWHLAGTVGTVAKIMNGRDVEQALTGGIGESTLSVTGHLRDPLTLGGPSLHLDVAGPDVAAALAVFGMRSPLTGAYKAAARLSPEGERVGVALEATVGDVTGKAEGTMDALLEPAHGRVRVETSGPDASVVGGWTRVRGLPKKPFRVAGGVGWENRRVLLDALDVHAGDTTVRVDGEISTERRSVGTDLAVDARGANLEELSELCHVALPKGSFTLKGRFLRRADALAIGATRLTSGDTTIDASGAIGEPPAVENMNLAVDGRGPDASWLTPVARFDLPPEPFDLRGSVKRAGSAVVLEQVAGHLGGVAFGADGRIVPVRGIVGSAGHLHAGGEDLGRFAALLGVGKLPAQPFDIAGDVSVASDGYLLETVVARVGTMDATAAGRVSRDASALDGRVSGNDLADLAAWGITVALPHDPFEVEGGLRIDRGAYHVEHASGTVGHDAFEVDGVVGATSDIGVKVSGKSVASLARFFPDPPERLPDAPFEASGKLHRTPEGLTVSDAHGTIGNAKVSVDGTSFKLEAPDTTMAASILGHRLPEGALRAEGRVAHGAGGYDLDRVSVGIGPADAEVSGTLGVPPELTGTSLDVSFEGPDLAAVLGPLTEMSPLPQDAFSVSGHVAGDRRRLASEKLAVRLGDSDLAGKVALTLEEKPFLDLDVQGKKLDIGRLSGGFTTPSEPPEKEPSQKKKLVLPDTPLKLDALRALEARIRLAASDVQWLGVPLRDVSIEGSIRDGGVRVNRFDGIGENGGRASASLAIVPDGDGYRLTTAGRLEGGRLNVFGKHETAQSTPTLDFEFQLAGAGRSLREIAAGSDGQALLTLGPGKIPNSWVNTFGSGFLLSLLDTLNPFRKASPDTPLECGVAAAVIEGGKMVVDPIAVRTDKLTVIGHGQLDFKTEAIDLVWTLKPRQGVGISAGMITNPFIKLGGTLASPHLDAKPLSAAATTGAAVATAGITVLLKGVYDRITAERKVCARALTKARKQQEKLEAEKKPESPDE